MARRRAIRAEGEERGRLGLGLGRYCGRDATQMHGVPEKVGAMAGEA